MHALCCSIFEYHLDVLHFLLLENLMDKHISQVKKLKAISVSTVGNEWPREARAATQSPNGTENLICIFVFVWCRKEP